MKVGLGSDRAGEALRSIIQEHLLAEAESDLTVVSMVSSTGGTTYGPELAESIGVAVVNGSIDRGILVCSSGVGLAIAANKIPGVRAALCSDVDTAIHSRKSSDTQVLVLGRNSVSPPLALAIVDAWLAAAFEPNDRRRTRLDLLRGLEHRYMRPVGEDGEDPATREKAQLTADV